ncbi:MAG: cation transporter, partial [Fibrobacterota bacterium]|nr:cation transporter [Chitinispirillaceae bacterium]
MKRIITYISVLIVVVLAGCSDKTPKVSVKMDIHGMYCAACVVSVDNALKSVPGVSKVRVNAARAEASVDIDVAMLDSIKLVDAV